MPLVRWRDETGALRQARSQEPARVVAELVAALGREPGDLEVIRPSLEDVYLGLVRGARPETENNRETEVRA